jgi:hypothetical protein
VSLKFEAGYIYLVPITTYQSFEPQDQRLTSISSSISSTPQTLTMLYQTLACLTTLLTLSSAIPTAPPDLTKRDTITRVTPVVKLAGSPLNGQLINAAYGGFFIGRKTTIGQCAIFAGCDTYSNITAINFNQEKASGTLVP